MRSFAFIALMLPLLGSLAWAAAAQAIPVSRPVGCTEDLDQVINDDPPTTATQFVLEDCAYPVDATLTPKDGDEVIGAEGTYMLRTPAYDPSTTTTIVGLPPLAQVMKPTGTVTLEWLTVEGGTFKGKSGTGVGIAMGTMSDDSVMQAVTVQDNEAAGLSNMHGTFNRIELTNNTTNPNALGFIGAGGKAVNEVAVTESFVHDTQGNGLWCDQTCKDTVLGSWKISDSRLVDNGRAGLRYENVPAGGGEAEIIGNVIQGNGTTEERGGVDVRDAQNALIRGNTFGQNGTAVRATGSGKPDRPALLAVEIRNNELAGDDTVGCDLPDDVVVCVGNTP